MEAARVAAVLAAHLAQSRFTTGRTAANRCLASWAEPPTAVMPNLPSMAMPDSMWSTTPVPV